MLEEGSSDERIAPPSMGSSSLRSRPLRFCVLYISARRQHLLRATDFFDRGMNKLSIAVIRASIGVNPPWFCRT